MGVLSLPNVHLPGTFAKSVVTDVLDVYSTDFNLTYLNFTGSRKCWQISLVIF